MKIRKLRDSVTLFSPEIPVEFIIALLSIALVAVVVMAVSVGASMGYDAGFVNGYSDAVGQVSGRLMSTERQLDDARKRYDCIVRGGHPVPTLTGFDDYDHCGYGR